MLFLLLFIDVVVVLVFFFFSSCYCYFLRLQCLLFEQILMSNYTFTLYLFINIENPVLCRWAVQHMLQFWIPYNQGLQWNFAGNNTKPWICPLHSGWHNRKPVCNNLFWNILHTIPKWRYRLIGCRLATKANVSYKAN